MRTAPDSLARRRLALKSDRRLGSIDAARRRATACLAVAGMVEEADATSGNNRSCLRHRLQQRDHSGLRRAIVQQITNGGLPERKVRTVGPARIRES